MDADGTTHDKVFDVAWAGERQPGAEGKLPPVGNTVDLTTATYRNTIGSGELAAVWEDPEFDPDQRALYYTRVLEIPTPRWTTFDSVRGRAARAGQCAQHRAGARLVVAYLVPALMADLAGARHREPAIRPNEFGLNSPGGCLRRSLLLLACHPLLDPGIQHIKRHGPLVQHHVVKRRKVELLTQLF